MTTADGGRGPVISGAAGAGVERGVDADVEEGIHCGADLPPVERDGRRGRDGDLACT